LDLFLSPFSVPKEKAKPEQRPLNVISGPYKTRLILLNISDNAKADCKAVNPIMERQINGPGPFFCFLIMAFAPTLTGSLITVTRNKQKRKEKIAKVLSVTRAEL
jgi:hypothetical protein